MDLPPAIVRVLVLAALTIQNAGAVLLMRWVRAFPSENRFNSQTAVVMQELVKGLSCALLLLYTEGSLISAYRNAREALKTSIPAVLYLGQNNLQYIAVGHLSAAAFTITYQSKTLWAAVLSFFLLGRTLNSNKWVGLACLSLGVGLVQVSVASGGGRESKVEGHSGQNHFLGFVTILLAGLLSAGAGVSFEKFLKGVKISLWARNVQLAFYSVLTAVIPLVLSGQLGTVLSQGFFHGYTTWTWVCILMNSFGGLLVGVVIRYADAITKDVALGASVLVSSIASIGLFGFSVTPMFVLGGVLVVVAVLIYGERIKVDGFVSKPLNDLSLTVAGSFRWGDCLKRLRKTFLDLSTPKGEKGKGGRANDRKFTGEAHRGDGTRSGSVDSTASGPTHHDEESPKPKGPNHHYLPLRGEQISMSPPGVSSVSPPSVASHQEHHMMHRHAHHPGGVDASPVVGAEAIGAGPAKQNYALHAYESHAASAAIRGGPLTYSQSNSRT
uniref:EamA domain-containing protein n=1 Tax=Chromera velia CCMP2878 TaxID=1169474 RepID=A0A0G4IDU3_9ALVE|eukprot:Cvel_13389.t1-p1 / transcript=Cvel_13389.t1 / gene=Cvel_13389 / organism=Chromera_velia_CCMP2878 / gene_product=UDP-galactose translocator, putative / transcript_product=UDP-galactose translocator, putative / location=Cvel_scaffold911:53611-55768(-) / protein_length=497 / sequence_SO=supercontig / SO=protein_coding / is_pseudo=false